MRKSLFTKQNETLIHCLIKARKVANMTQQALADQLKRPQSFVAKYENGDRRLDVVEFLTITEILNADPHEILRRMKRGQKN